MAVTALKTGDTGWSDGPHPSAPSPASATLLETLRDLARGAQLSGPLDLDHGCALIAATGDADPRAAGAALVRAVDAASLRPLVFHRRPGGAPAFGEAWLLRLVETLRDGDADSATFLVHRMIRRDRRRVVLWLAGRFAASLRCEDRVCAGAAQQTC